MSQEEVQPTIQGPIQLMDDLLWEGLQPNNRFKDLAKALRGDISGLSNAEVLVINYIHEEFPRQEGGLLLSVFDLAVAVKGPFAEQNIVENPTAHRLKSAIEEALQLLKTPNMRFIAEDTLKKAIRP